MAYIANHIIEHNRKLYEKGDEVPLSYEKAQALIKHGAITKYGKAEQPKGEEPKPTKAKDKKAKDEKPKAEEPKAEKPEGN